MPLEDALVFDTGALERLLNGPEGPVAADLLYRAIRVEAAAKNFATGNNGGPRVRTGRLRSSITHAIGKDERSVFVDVGSGVEYAGFVELGTRRSKAYPYLRPALAAAVN